MSTPLTGDQIRTMFNTITDDELDDDQFYIFLNVAKDTIEASRDWNFNRGFDSSNLVGASDNYLTTKALPSDFMAPRRVYLHNYLTPLVLIPFEQRERYKDVSKRYYIDWMNRVFAICGAASAAGQTINIYYARSSPTITATSSPVWPAAFHPLLGFKAAEMFMSGSDSDDLNARMSVQNLRLANDILKSMIAWDSKIKTEEYNAKNERNVDLSTYPNIVGDGFIY